MADEVVRKTTTRKRATKTTAKTTTRKAPPRTAESVPPVAEGSRSYTPLIVAAVLVVFIGGSVAIGFSDSGQINVSSTISDHRSSGTAEEQANMQHIPVQQNRPTKPLGGLVPSQSENVPPPQVESASTTASTSEVTASSTDEAATAPETDTDTDTVDETTEPAADSSETAETESVPAESTPESSTTPEPVATDAPAV